MGKTSVGCVGELGLRGKFYMDLKVEMAVVNEWLEPFLKITFFGACSVHQNEQKNDLNRFFMCEESACKHCIVVGLHGDHQLLTIYRHVYKDVVPFCDMKVHIDCSKIQMPAEFQLPAPIMPTHSAYFTRYCKKHADGIWAIADLSIGSSHPSPLMRFHRRPSGCLIGAITSEYSKVTWVEHVEVDDRYVHQLYKPLVDSSLSFGAQRWLDILGSQCERKASVLASIPSSDLANMGISNQEGRRSLMRLAARLVRSYNQGVSSTTAHTWAILAGSGVNDVRVISRKSIGEPGKPTGFVLCGDSDYISILPSCISVLPDGTERLAAAAGDDNNAAGGSLLTVTFSIQVDSDPDVRINHGGLATINGLITWTVVRITAYVTESGDNGFAVVNRANLVHNTRWPHEYTGMKKQGRKMHGKLKPLKL